MNQVAVWSAGSLASDRHLLSWQQSAVAAAARGSDSVAHVEKAAAGSADLLAVRTRADRVSVHVRCPAGEVRLTATCLTARTAPEGPAVGRAQRDGRRRTSSDL